MELEPKFHIILLKDNTLLYLSGLNPVIGFTFVENVKQAREYTENIAKAIISYLEQHQELKNHLKVIESDSTIRWSAKAIQKYSVVYHGHIETITLRR